MLPSVHVQLIPLHQTSHIRIDTTKPTLSTSDSTRNVTFSSCAISMSTAVFYSLSTVCHYITLYRPLGLCHYVYCCLVESVQCLSESHIVPTVGSLHCSHCSLLQSVHSPSVPQSVPSVRSTSICPLLFLTVCRLSNGILQCTAFWFCVTIPTAVFCSQYLSVSTTKFTACWLCVTVSTAVFCSQSTAVFCSLSAAPFYSLFTINTSQCTITCLCVTVPSLSSMTILCLSVSLI